MAIQLYPTDIIVPYFTLKPAFLKATNPLRESMTLGSVNIVCLQVDNSELLVDSLIKLHPSIHPSVRIMLGKSIHSINPSICIHASIHPFKASTYNTKHQVSTCTNVVNRKSSP